MTDGIMIAFLPTEGYWCKQPLPHLTLVYAGKTAEHEYSSFNQLAKDAISLSLQMVPFRLSVTGIEVFGDEDSRVEVLTLDTTPELTRARQLVEHWNASEHKEFKPHCTVGEIGSARGVLPTSLFFDRIMVAFGTEEMIFMLNGYERRKMLAATEARGDY